MKLHYAQNSRAVRVAWMLEELELSYEVEKYSLGAPEMRSSEYATLHPLGRVPVLEDGAVTLFESGAIVQYLLARYGNGRFVPEVASPNFPLYLQWLHYAEGMIMPPVNIIVVETILLPPDRRNEVNVKRARKLLTNMLAALEAHMTDRAYLANDFSGADVITGHATMISRDLGVDFTTFPALSTYVDRLLQRPALQKAMVL